MHLFPLISPSYISFNTTLNSDPDLNNINSTNSIKKNNSFIIRQKNELNNINNKTKKITDISNISNIPINNY